MARASSDAAKVREFIRRLGESATGPGRVYLVGGASAVLIGWRAATVDVDVKLAPEPAGAFAAIAQLKEDLDMNVELAAPDEFLPPLPDWPARSPFIARHGQVGFFHYDFYGQAIAKIERGHAQDRRDVQAMFRRGLVLPAELEALFAAIGPDIVRYPAVDAPSLGRKVRAAMAAMDVPAP